MCTSFAHLFFSGVAGELFLTNFRLLFVQHCSSSPGLASASPLKGKGKAEELVNFSVPLAHLRQLSHRHKNQLRLRLWHGQQMTITFYNHSSNASKAFSSPMGSGKDKDNKGALRKDESERGLNVIDAGDDLPACKRFFNRVNSRLLTVNPALENHFYLSINSRLNSRPETRQSVSAPASSLSLAAESVSTATTHGCKEKTQRRPAGFRGKFVGAR